VFCGKQHLKQERKRVNILTGETKVTQQTLFYIRNAYGELVPCCKLCKETLENLEKGRRGEVEEVTA